MIILHFHLQPQFKYESFHILIHITIEIIQYLSSLMFTQSTHAYRRFLSRSLTILIIMFISHFFFSVSFFRFVSAFEQCFFIHI